MDRSSSTQLRHGTHRAVSSEETLRQLETLHLELGITRVGDATGMDCIGIPTAIVVRPNARSVGVSLASGTTLIAAKAAAVMAAVERHHAERMECPLRLCSPAELRAEHRIVEPEAVCARAEHGQLALARAGSQNEPILWAEARTLDGAMIWVPLGLVHLDLRRLAPLGSDPFVVGADGLGAGNTLEEAIVQSVCEVVDRSALTSFYAGSEADRQRRRLDLASVDDPACRELLARYAEADVDVAVWDLASELRIPCFLCGVRDNPGAATRPVELTTGTGCHPSRAVALARALCEAAQHRVARIVTARDEATVLLGRLDRGAPLSFESAAPAATRYLDAPTFESASVGDDVAWLRQRLETSNVTLAVVDLSRSKYPVHVVRAVASGLGARSDQPKSLALGAP